MSCIILKYFIIKTFSGKSISRIAPTPKTENLELKLYGK